MAKVMIVPSRDYEILKKYLAEDVVLVPEPVLNAFPANAKSKCRSLESKNIPYDFGGEPDIRVDIIHDKGAYAYGELFEGDEDDEA